MKKLTSYNIAFTLSHLSAVLSVLRATAMTYNTMFTNIAQDCFHKMRKSYHALSILNHAEIQPELWQSLCLCLLVLKICECGLFVFCKVVLGRNKKQENNTHKENEIYTSEQSLNIQIESITLFSIFSFIDYPHF